MPPVLPLEIIEHTIGFLYDDPDALAHCALVCHALLPVCRSLRWHRVALPRRHLKRHLNASLRGVADNPCLVPYVRALDVNITVPVRGESGSPSEPSGAAYAGADPSPTELLRTACRRLTALREVRLFDLFSGGLIELLHLAVDIPTLETLVLHMERVLADLLRCGELRALTVYYDCSLATGESIYYHTNDAGGNLPLTGVPLPFFLDALADVLDGGSDSPGCAPPFPLLARLTVVVFAPPGQLVKWEEAFGRLARALLATDGGAERARTRVRRYPRFARLRVETRCLEVVAVLLGDARAREMRVRQEADGRELVRTLLEDFAQAGVEVEVVVG
ncbi:hypothetical protein C8Q78DRAFT_1082788 [Trametes maxima]|nr:hypothetical protein C8Q78DRAFT_1082788 [Trametes maxima]